MTKEEFKNLAVGETFTLGLKKFKVEKKEGLEEACSGCYFYDNIMFHCSKAVNVGIIPECIICFRKDKTFVRFVEVENESVE